MINLHGGVPARGRFAVMSAESAFG